MDSFSTTSSITAALRRSNCSLSTEEAFLNNNHLTATAVHPANEEQQQGNHNSWTGSVNNNAVAVAAPTWNGKYSVRSHHQINQMISTNQQPAAGYVEVVQQQLLPPLTTANLFVLEELRGRARRHVEDYIRQVIPMDQKQAYLEALRKAPHVVARESDPILFVRYCDYNVWQAAERLLRYWTARKEAFGEDRAFRPLTITGDGALNPDDILSLKAGYPCLLPNTTNGQQVMLADRRQYVAHATCQTRMRGTFYLIYLMSQDDRTQTNEGVLLLVLLVMQRVQNYDQEFVRKVYTVSLEAFPIKFHVHLLNCLPKASSKRYMVQDVISSYILQVTSLGYQSEKLQVHIEREEGQILKELLALGLSKDGIPTHVGGNWTFQQIGPWCRKRIEEERSIMECAEYRTNDNARSIEELFANSGAPNRDSTNVDGGGGDHASTPATSLFMSTSTNGIGDWWKEFHDNMCSSNSTQEKGSGDSQQTNTNNEEDEIMRRRAYNVIHCRRKRARQRQEFENLRTESRQLKEDHAKLVSEQERLTMLLQQANDILVEQHQQEQREIQPEHVQSQNFKRLRRKKRSKAS